MILFNVVIIQPSWMEWCILSRKQWLVSIFVHGIPTSCHFDEEFVLFDYLTFLSFCFFVDYWRMKRNIYNLAFIIILLDLCSYWNRVTIIK